MQGKSLKYSFIYGELLVKKKKKHKKKNKFKCHDLQNNLNITY